MKTIGLTGVIGISMPLSIIGTFVLLYFSNTTLNMVSLGGISIGVGMLVDNSIVVLENIYRYRTTLNYGILFSQGIVLQMMKDLALAIVFSLIMSLFVAMTVVPMLAGNYVDNLHRNKSKKFNFINNILDLFDRFIKSLTKSYEKILAYAISRKKRVLLFALLISISSAFLLPMVGMEFIPEGDEGVINITLKSPQGSNLDLTNAESSKFEEYLNTLTELKSMTAIMYGSEANYSSMMSSLSSGSSNEMRQKNNPLEVEKQCTYWTEEEINTSKQ